MTGRPKKFTDKLADEICERIAEGESLRSICGDEEMPNRATVFRWLTDAKLVGFRDRYAHAREAQADALADEIVDIADDSSHDIVPGDEDEAERINHEVIARAKLRVDARKWVAAKLKPKKYGERQLLGSDPENPLPTGFSVRLVKPDDGD